MVQSTSALANAMRLGAKTKVIPGVFDALSAKLVEEAGFGVIYVGSYAAAASGYAWPDVGLLSLNDMTRLAGSVVQAVACPVIADAEGGFFDAPNIWRTVRAFERAGVSAIHIEDHGGGKHTNLPQTLEPIDTIVGKLKAALDARERDDFAIIGRTDAIWATHDPSEAMSRVRAFADAGLTHFFPTGATPDILRQMRAEVPGHYIAITHDDVVSPEHWDGAADIVIDYGFCLRVVAKSLSAALFRLGNGTRADQLASSLEEAEVFENRMGYAQFVDRAKRYTALPE